jgi:hypothetical protein
LKFIKERVRRDERGYPEIQYFFYRFGVEEKSKAASRISCDSRPAVIVALDNYLNLKRAGARNPKAMIPSHSRGDKYLHEIHS